MAKAKGGVTGKFSVEHIPFLTPPFPTDTGGRIRRDHAGEMTQIVANEPIRHVVYIDFQVDGKPRGNHYHQERKLHGLYVIRGKCVITLEDVDDKSRATVTAEEGDLIRIGSRCAHVFVAQEYTQMIELNDNAWDPADTIPYVVIGPKEEGK